MQNFFKPFNANFPKFFKVNITLWISIVALALAITNTYYNFFYEEDGFYINTIELLAHPPELKNLYAEMAFINSGTVDVLVTNIVVWLSIDNTPDKKIYIYHRLGFDEKKFSPIIVKPNSIHYFKLEETANLDIIEHYYNIEDILGEHFIVNWHFTTISPLDGIKETEIEWGTISFESPGIIQISYPSVYERIR